MSETESSKRKSFLSYITPVITTIVISALLACTTSLINLYAQNGIMREKLRTHEKTLDRLSEKVERLEACE